MTAAHVIQVADAVEVKFKDGRVAAAKVVGSSPWSSIALLKLENPPPNLTVAQLADSDKTKIGEKVFVIGAPQGFEYSLTAG